jgi:hypothetical protein
MGESPDPGSFGNANADVRAWDDRGREKKKTSEPADHHWHLPQFFSPAPAHIGRACRAGATATTVHPREGRRAHDAHPTVPSRTRTDGRGDSVGPEVGAYTGRRGRPSLNESFESVVLFPILSQPRATCPLPGTTCLDDMDRNTEHQHTPNWQSQIQSTCCCGHAVQPACHTHHHRPPAQLPEPPPPPTTTTIYNHHRHRPRDRPVGRNLTVPQWLMRAYAAS